MAKAPARFACQQCGAVHAKWTGRCEACGAWNSLIEELPRESLPKGLEAGGGRALGFVGLQGPSLLPPRRQTGIVELDRVCGGGFVPGSAILVGGDPGIGKSTLLLQAAAAIVAAASRIRCSLCLAGLIIPIRYHSLIGLASRLTARYRRCQRNWQRFVSRFCKLGR